MASAPILFTTQNCILAALPAEVTARLLPKLSRVSLANKQLLTAAEQPIDAVFFFESGMVSMVKHLDDGVQAEVGVVGREGMLGMPLVYGVETTFTDCMMQLPGHALRMGAGAFCQELADNAPLKRRLLLYSEAQQAQVSQTAACNGRHGLEQRLARWLLMAHDRADGDDVPLTQEFIATMLGVHRPSITVTAGILQRAGLIRYASGRITILDRASLEAASCECYATVRARFERLLN